MIDHYVLSEAADQDLEDIFDYTAREFGFTKAVEYLQDLENLFLKLVKNPQLGRLRSEIKEEIRCIPKASHVVFYHIKADHIRIIRVLHSSRDLPRFLD